MLILWRRRARSGSLALLALIGGAAFWSLGEGFELIAGNLEAIVIASKFEYVGVLTIPPVWLVFSLQFVPERRRLSPAILLALSVFPIVGMSLVFTNEWHHLIWVETWVATHGTLSMLGSTKGPFYWFIVCHAYTLLVIGTVFLIRSAIHRHRLHRKQALILLIMILAPLSANVVYQLRLSPIPYLDLTPMAFTICALALTWDFLRYGLLFSGEPVSKDQIIQSMREGVVVVDLDHQILDLNAAARSVLGATPQDLRGIRIHTVFNMPTHFPDRESCNQNTSITVQHDRTRMYEVSASTFRTRFAGVIGYVLVLRDVTERKQAEEALHDSEVRYRSLFNTMADGVFLIRSDGSIEDVNDAACRQVGFPKHELQAMTIWDVSSYTDLQKQSVLRVLEKRAPARFESEHLHKNGDPIPVDLHISVVEYGQEPHILSIARDITVGKQAEEERDRLRAQLYEAQKMESVGRLAGGIAHDFNNILAVILGYAEILLSELPRELTASGEIQEIVTAGERARDLVRQLLAFSRKQILDFRVLDLNNLLKDFERMLHRLIGEDIVIELVVPACPIYIKADAGQLEQVVLNLCVNARDAMSDGGLLTIETRPVVIEAPIIQPHIEIKPGTYAVLSVTDTGHGMDEATREQIFDPFFTTKEQGKGTGLGLATVFGIVKQHGGEIDVETEPECGTTFRIYLPEYREPPSPVPEDASKSPVHGHGEVVLVLEDDEAVRNLLCLVLTRHGYHVVESRTATECLALAQSLDCVDLLVTDVVMPGMNGKDVCDRMAAIRPNLKALFISGYPDHVIAASGVLEEGLHLLAKPFSEAALCQKVRELLDEASQSPHSDRSL